MLLLSILMWVGSIFVRLYSVTKTILWLVFNYKTYKGIILSLLKHSGRRK